MTRLIDWAVLERGVARVEWHTNARNERSLAVARRLGFSLDGRRSSGRPASAGGRKNDMQVWSVLADDWRPRR